MTVKTFDELADLVQYAGPINNTEPLLNAIKETLDTYAQRETEHGQVYAQVVAERDNIGAAFLQRSRQLDEVLQKIPAGATQLSRRDIFANAALNGIIGGVSYHGDADIAAAIASAVAYADALIAALDAKNVTG